jgi:hypothetical protein
MHPIFAARAANCPAVSGNLALRSIPVKSQSAAHKSA